jgi:hypothetical protein
MFCDHCGTQVLESQAFCPSCGKSMRATAPMRVVPGRVAANVRTLGIMWLAYSVFRLLTGWFLASMFPAFFNWWPAAHIPFFVGDLVRVAGIATMATAALGIIVGWGLLECHPWARIMAIVLGILALLKIPIGTALGVYTLWVLAPAESGREYEQIARAAGRVA